MLGLQGHSGALYLAGEPVTNGIKDWHNYTQEKVFSRALVSGQINPNEVIANILSMIKETVWKGTIEGFDNADMDKVLAAIDSPYTSAKGKPLVFLRDHESEEIDLNVQAQVDKFIKGFQPEVRAEVGIAIKDLKKRYDALNLSYPGTVQTLLDLCARQKLFVLKLTDEITNCK